MMSLFFSMFGKAQGSEESFMRSHQKIYVVVAVLFIILLGLLAFLFSLDARLKKLENRFDKG
jgi:cytochrome c biogenesis protein CcdA